MGDAGSFVTLSGALGPLRTLRALGTYQKGSKSQRVMKSACAYFIQRPFGAPSFAGFEVQNTMSPEGKERNEVHAMWVTVQGARIIATAPDSLRAKREKLTAFLQRQHRQANVCDLDNSPNLENGGYYHT